MTDSVFNIHIETENGNYEWGASQVLVLLSNYYSNKVENNNIEYIKVCNIKISSDVELESDVDGDKSDKLPVDIKILGNHIEVFSGMKE